MARTDSIKKVVQLRREVRSKANEHFSQMPGLEGKPKQFKEFTNLVRTVTHKVVAEINTERESAGLPGVMLKEHAIIAKEVMQTAEDRRRYNTRPRATQQPTQQHQ